MASEKEALAEMKAAVQARTNLLESIKAAFQFVISLINDTDDVEEIRAITAEMSAQDTNIAQWIADNTPAAPVANETGPAVEPPAEAPATSEGEAME